MILPEGKLDAVVALLRGFGAKRVLLFGSYLRNSSKAQDLDIAVEGIPLARLLDADAGAYEILRQPLDLVSREEDPAFFDHISSGAKVLYAA
jgi:predicted nucleotidyltransferase